MWVWVFVCVHFLSSLCFGVILVSFLCFYNTPRTDFRTHTLAHILCNYAVFVWVSFPRLIAASVVFTISFTCKTFFFSLFLAHNIMSWCWCWCPKGRVTFLPMADKRSPQCVVAGLIVNIFCLCLFLMVSVSEFDFQSHMYLLWDSQKNRKIWQWGGNIVYVGKINQRVLK